MLDFGKINAGLVTKKQIDPRRIFSTLNRDAKFKRPSDEQADVLDAWFARRNQRNITVKMNTGAGKTVVGLLCLQSSLNEGVGPAVYITPDIYLTKQVVREAQQLGIAVTEDERSPAFLSQEAILVTNIWKLVNARSVFGVGTTGIKIEIGSLVIDDAHACLATAGDQFKITLPNSEGIYYELLDLFKDDLSAQSQPGLLDVQANDPQAVMIVPFWAWQNKQRQLLEILHPQRESDSLKWAWRLLENVLPFCQCAIGGTALEIAPRFIPMDNIPAFTAAKRRIYMTATLADDSILVSHFQAAAAEVADAIRPKGGGDIGDRMILAPQEITPDITTDEVKALAFELAKTVNVAVIVPSKKRSEYWLSNANQILTAENMESGINALRKGHVGLTVFVGKYDGVDLPGDACRVLIIDGLPEVTGLIDRVENSLLDGTPRQLARQIQRIEQGMGRGVRSSEDYCVVLLLGGRLTQRLHSKEARDMFSVATRAQLDLGREVTSQLKGKPIADIADVMKLCLDRDTSWVTVSRAAVVNAEDSQAGHMDENIVRLRAAFDEARVNRYDKAQTSVQQAISHTQDNRTKGYYKQQLAEYVHHVNEPQAQEILLSAISLNRSVVRPLAGVAYSKLVSPNKAQADMATDFMRQRFLEGNELVIWSNSLLEGLIWGEEYTSGFELAMMDLGRYLGFGSQRPEKDIGRGPDNLWALGALKYLVIEDKSGATQAKAITKHDCNQLNGSMVWFSETYDHSCVATPVMVHMKITPEHAATLTDGTRIITEEKLSALKDNIRKYTAALSVQGAFKDAVQVAKQLEHFNLTAGKFIPTYSVSHSPK